MQRQLVSSRHFVHSICSLSLHLYIFVLRNFSFLDVDDIIDETIMYFRANTLFRNFDVRSGSDKTLIYLTLFAQQCLVKCERIEDKSMATKELRALATKQFVIPGESGWPLGGLFAAPADRKESGNY